MKKSTIGKVCLLVVLSYLFGYQIHLMETTDEVVWYYVVNFILLAFGWSGCMVWLTAGEF